jgi:hypothetical protein
VVIDIVQMDHIGPNLVQQRSNAPDGRAIIDNPLWNPQSIPKTQMVEVHGFKEVPLIARGLIARVAHGERDYTVTTTFQQPCEIEQVTFRTRPDVVILVDL